MKGTQRTVETAIMARALDRSSAFAIDTPAFPLRLRALAATTSTPRSRTFPAQHPVHA